MCSLPSFWLEVGVGLSEIGHISHDLFATQMASQFGKAPKWYDSCAFDLRLGVSGLGEGQSSEFMMELIFGWLLASST